MTAITRDAIRELAAFKGESAPVTSCYLDVDGRRHLRSSDYEQELHQLLKRARTKVNGDASVAGDFDRIERHVRGGVDRSTVRGLAMFSCTAHDFFRSLPLPVPVRTQLVVNPVPAVGQLERVVHEYERFGVLLVDRQRARMFVFELGRLLDRSELFDDLPRDYDERGERERGDTRPHVEELVHQHLRHAAGVAFRVFKETGFEHLAIGAPNAIARELEDSLHPYLRERLRGRVDVTPTAPAEHVRAAAIDLELRVERQREDVMVARLREAVARGGRGVAGLDPVLRALGEHRVDRLLVSQGYSEPGWLCPGCGGLNAVGRVCKVCRGEMRPIDDVVEEAVEVALAQSRAVEICVGNADLDVMGRIGALLRF